MPNPKCEVMDERKRSEPSREVDVQRVSLVGAEPDDRDIGGAVDDPSGLIGDGEGEAAVGEAVGAVHPFAPG